VVSPRIWLTIAALTGVAVLLLVAPTYRVSDAVIYALVIADFIAIGLIARDARALWASVAFAAGSSTRRRQCTASNPSSDVPCRLPVATITGPQQLDARLRRRRPSALPATHAG
jgi:hypothetical protein